MHWHFSSLAALADYIENKAREVRGRADILPASSKRRLLLQATAAAYESDAHVIRRSKIDGVPDLIDDKPTATVHLNAPQS